MLILLLRVGGEAERLSPPLAVADAAGVAQGLRGSDQIRIRKGGRVMVLTRLSMDREQTLGPSGPPRQSGVLVVWQSAQALEASSGGRQVLGSASISIPMFMESSQRRGGSEMDGRLGGPLAGRAGGF